MNIGVVGLGLIGGSLAAAYKKAGHRILGSDLDKSIRGLAQLSGSISEELTPENLGECEVVFIAIKPQAACEWLQENKERIAKGALVVDCCGVKEPICKIGFSCGRQQGFTFVGGHPMAGKQVGGFKNSSAELFHQASFVMVPEDRNDIVLISRLKGMLQEAGFGKFILLTPEEHDKVIAFTSQLAHLVANAYIKSDTAQVEGTAKVVGGSFRDMTRVAYLDESMWTELFMANKENLLRELDGLMEELEKYRGAIEAGDEKTLSRLLTEGKNIKIEMEEQGRF